MCDPHFGNTNKFNNEIKEIEMIFCEVFISENGERLAISFFKIQVSILKFQIAY